MGKTVFRTERKSARRYRIAVAVILAGIPGQRKLAGIFSKFNKFGDWDIRIFRSQEEITAEFGKRKPVDFDGVIYSGFYNRAVFANLTKFAGPLIVMDNDPVELRRRSAPTAVIRNSATAIAEAAKRYHDDVDGFKSVGYIHERLPTDWSKARGEALSAAVDGVRIFESSGQNEKSDRKPLQKFLTSLERPSMVLCANDARALETLSAAKAAGIDVPSELTIIGVDNDPYLCGGISPSLSSIEPDHFREGETAAQKLDEMLREGSGKPDCERLYIGVLSVILRESALKRKTSKGLTYQAREYIVRNACRGISPADVAQAVGVSRPLLDLRLREARMPTLASMIADAQLESVAKMLTETDDPIEVISDRCGFANHRSLKNRFKARYGMSMRDYRSLFATPF